MPKFIDDVLLCADCLVEVERKRNEIDSYEVCPKCQKDNFTGSLKVIEAEKVITEKVEYKMKKTKE